MSKSFGIAWKVHFFTFHLAKLAIFSIHHLEIVYTNLSTGFLSNRFRFFLSFEQISCGLFFSIFKTFKECNMLDRSSWMTIVNLHPLNKINCFYLQNYTPDDDSFWPDGASLLLTDTGRTSRRFDVICSWPIITSDISFSQDVWYWSSKGYVKFGGDIWFRFWAIKI